jgi:AcrR family transcriptional regulator
VIEPGTDGKSTAAVLSPQDLRRSAMMAAFRLFAEGGGEKLSARALAQAIGASTKVIYSHFGGMTQVVDEVRAEAERRLSERLRVGDIPSLSRVDRLARMASAYRDFARSEPHLFDLLCGPDAREWDPAAIAMAQAIIAPPHATPAATDATLPQARVFWAMIHGPVRLERTGALGSAADDIFAAVLAQAIRGAIAPPLRQGRA